MCVECRLCANGTDDPIRTTVFDSVTTQSKFTWIFARHRISKPATQNECKHEGVLKMGNTGKSHVRRTPGEMRCVSINVQREIEIHYWKCHFSPICRSSTGSWRCGITAHTTVRNSENIPFSLRFENDFDYYYFVVRRPTTPESIYEANLYIATSKCRSYEFVEILQFLQWHSRVASYNHRRSIAI